MMAKIAPRFAPDGLIKIVTKTRNPADALWSTQRRLLTLTAGPLAGIKTITQRQLLAYENNRKFSYPENEIQNEKRPLTSKYNLSIT